MDEVRRTVLRQQKIEELCAASLRALTGDHDLHFKGRRLYKGTTPIAVHAPHLQLDLEQDDFTSYRGMTDSIALRIRYSDAQLHARLSPREPVERLVFDLLEQLRVETLAPETMPGMIRNMRYRFEQWSKHLYLSGVTESDVGMLLYAVSQICWARLHGLPVWEQTEDLLEPTRGALGALLGHDLVGIKRHRQDQLAYARHARSIASVIAQSINDALSVGQDSDGQDNGRRALFSLLNFEQNDAGEIATAPTGESKALGEALQSYRVYTTKYDREVNANSLVRPALLKQLRLQLDKKIQNQGINIPRLARLFASLLATPQLDGWTFAQEEGYVDGRRLAQLVTSPAERRLFRWQQYRPHARCLLTVLIDCSGSMREHMESIAMLIDILTRALEHAEVTTEVLGFTTAAWSGGRAQRDWIRQGQCKHPGRLNERCHIIYKDADTSWRRARSAIAALLKADLFREGIDGEAVEWACSRLIPRREQRKILIVISDGSPMDTATALANDTFYLDNHLKQVVGRREISGDVEVYGLGVGLDLSPFYSRSLAIDISSEISNHLFFEIIQMLRGQHRR